VLVAPEGAGEAGKPTAEGGAEAVVVLTPEGFAIKHASGASETFVSLTAETLGAKNASGGNEVAVIIAAFGAMAAPPLRGVLAAPVTGRCRVTVAGDMLAASVTGRRRATVRAPLLGVRVRKGRKVEVL
jgi:hypothetical protein